jgi:hypothetical protein
MKSNSSIGGNNPPPDAAFALHVDELFSLLSDTLSGGEVDSDEKEAAIAEIAEEFHKAEKDADKARVAEKKPHDDAAKAVQVKWKPIIDKATAGKRACLDAVTPYRTAKQRAKDEAARKAREEAEAKERAAQEVLRQSDDLETKFRAEQELEDAKRLAATVNRIDRSATGLRTYYEAEITDRKAALLHYLAKFPERFEALIQQMASEDARGARAPVPGVVFHEIKRAV